MERDRTMKQKAVNKKANGLWEIEQTEIGRINRKIEKSVSDVVAGSPGAVSETIRLAKERERILIERTARK